MTIFSKKAQYLAGPGLPLINSVNWNPAIHPRDSDGEFRYNGGRHRPDRSTRTGEGDESALSNALSKLTIDRTYKDLNNGKANLHGIYITHYGPGTEVGGWDHNNDKGTNRGVGNNENKLNKLSLAVSKDIVRSAHLKKGDKVYINGQYIGNYDDKPESDGRIDIYDPDNLVGANWGGMVWGGVVSSHP